MSRHDQESLLLAIAMLAATFVFAAAVNDRAAFSKDEAVITRLEAKTTHAPSVAESAVAQTTNSSPTVPLNSAPGENLSKKLNQSNGVIHPKEVDPGIEKKPAPNTEDQNVVPPPGTPGGATAPKPK